MTVSPTARRGAAACAQRDLPALRVLWAANHVGWRVFKKEVRQPLPTRHCRSACTPLLSLVGVSVVIERGRQQNDGLVNGEGSAVRGDRPRL